MVRFETFRIRNAGPFKKVDLNLKRRGLVRIKGPNGIGKSTMWHQFTNVVHGTSPTKLSKNEMMSEEKDFLLELSFEKNGSRYVAAQAIKSKEKNPAGEKYNTGVYLFRDGQDISMHRDPDTQKLIKQTLGWTIEEWYGYVYLAQQTSHTLIHGTRSERQNYLSALFNLSPLDMLNKLYAGKSDALEDQIADLEKQKQEYAVKESLLAGRVPGLLESKLLEVQESAEVIQTKLKSLQRQQSRWEQRCELELKLSEIPEVSENPNVLKDEIAQLTEQQAYLAVAVNRLHELTQQLETLDNHSLAEPVELPADHVEVLGSPDISLSDDQAKLKRLESVLSQIRDTKAPEIPDDFQSILDGPDIAVDRVRREIQQIRSRKPAPEFPRPEPQDLEAAEKRRANFQQELADKKHEIKHLTFHGTQCPTCGTSLDQQGRQARELELKEEIEAMELSVRQVEARIRQTNDRTQAWLAHDAQGPDRSGEIPGLEREIENFQKKQEYKKILEAKQEHEQTLRYREEVAEIPALKARIFRYQQKKHYLDLIEQRERHTKYLSERDRLQKEIEGIEVKSDMSEKLAELNAALDTLNQREQLRAQIAELSALKDQSAKIARFQAESEQSQNEIGSIQTELKEVRSLGTALTELSAEIASKESLYREKKKCDVLAKAFGKAGQLRERQLSKFSRYLEEALLAHTIRQLPEHRFKIVVDDGIDILTSKNGGKYYDVRTMSGGEQGALSVAFLFALDDLLPPERRTSLKVVDEAEAAFDSERQKDFIQHTLPELRRRAETVIVISHSQAASHSAFDSVWEIKDGEVVDLSSEERVFEPEGA